VGLTVFSRRGGALRPKKARDGFGVDPAAGSEAWSAAWPAVEL